MLKAFYSAIQLSTKPDGFLCLPEDAIKDEFKVLIKKFYEKWGFNFLAELNLSNLLREFKELDQNMNDDLYVLIYLQFQV